MSGTDTDLGVAILADIANATARSLVAQREADKQREALHYVIRAAVASGTPVADIVRVTGLTRARIYQIRDHRR